MVTFIQLGVGIYLVGVVTMSGVVVQYLARVPRGARVPGAAWGSGIFAALLWPLVVLLFIFRVLAVRMRRRRRSLLAAAERAVSRQVARATMRRMRKGLRRLDFARRTNTFRGEGS